MLVMQRPLQLQLDTHCFSESVTKLSLNGPGFGLPPVDCENTSSFLLRPHNIFGAVLQKLALTNLLLCADYESKHANYAKIHAKYSKKYAEQYAKSTKKNMRELLISMNMLSMQFL
jgi:hypothetical protein